MLENRSAEYFYFAAIGFIKQVQPRPNPDQTLNASEASTSTTPHAPCMAIDVFAPPKQGAGHPTLRLAMATPTTTSPDGRHGRACVGMHMHVRVSWPWRRLVLAVAAFLAGVMTSIFTLCRGRSRTAWYHITSHHILYGQVKRGHFGEHSPMLNDISQLDSWTRVLTGLTRMYEGEVLGKLQVHVDRRHQHPHQHARTPHTHTHART